MQLTYDPAHNIAYIQFKDKSGPVDTIRVSDAMNVDMAPDGTIYGVELLNANEQLAGGGARSLVVINEAAGVRREISLAA